MDLTSLNNNQKEAVTTGLGPVLVLAGAGSGKTRVLAFRIAYLIENDMVAPANILSLTFTNKAAKEMQSRVQKLLGGEGDVFISGITKQKGFAMPTMGTFHSVGARFLRKEIQRLGYTRSFTIYDSEDSQKVIKEICQELSISAKFSPSFFRSLISTAKNQVQTPSEFNIGLDRNMHDLVLRVYTRYQNFLFKQNALDFDDLLLLPIKIFETFPDVLAKYRKIFEYILVDEYQDTNQAQYRFLKLLADKGNIFVVGDDAQSIYGFRGSDIRNILDFEHDFPNAKVFTLDQNYRSTKHILAAAQKVIELNSGQKPKVLWTENADGEQVSVEQVLDEQAEAEFVSNTVVSLASGEQISEEPEYDEEEEEKPFSILDQFLKKSGRSSMVYNLKKLPTIHEPLSDFAVVYRTHAQSRVFEEVFMASGVPYKIVGGVKFYERKEVKDVIAFLRLIVNPYDLVSIKRVIGVPPRGIGLKGYEDIKQVIEDITEGLAEKSAGAYFDALIKYFSARGSGRSVKATIDFFSTLQGVGNLGEEFSLVELGRLIIKKFGLELYYKDGTEMGQTRWENVEELINVMSNFAHVPWPQGLEQFLEEVALFTDLDSVDEGQDYVTMMTLHSAKGLEFDNVFFVGLEEGILPHSRSLLDPRELEEEIRLAYVGLTRAKKRLFLSFARSRTLYGSQTSGVPSRILSALPEGSIRHKAGLSESFRSSGLSDSGVTYEQFES